MVKRAEKTIQQKNKLEQEIKEKEEKLKELEKKAEQETGRYLLKQWDISDDLDSQLVFDVIDELKDNANEIINRKREEGLTGKSDI